MKTLMEELKPGEVTIVAGKTIMIDSNDGEWAGHREMGIPPGVTLIVSNGMGDKVCHGLALALVRDHLLAGCRGRVPVYSKKSFVRGRLLRLSGGGDDGLVNCWHLFGKDISDAVRKLGERSSYNSGCVDIRHFEAEFPKAIRRELGWFGPKMLLLDLDFADMKLLEGLNGLAKKRKCKVLVTTCIPLQRDGRSGDMSAAVVDVAMQTMCGIGLKGLVEKIVFIQRGVEVDADKYRFEVEAV